MELSFKHELGLVCVILLFPALCSCHVFVTNSSASYYNTPDGLGKPYGVCGFGEYGRTLNNGSVAAVSGRLYRNGAGCGTCYVVFCTIPRYCKTNAAAYVVVTDHGAGDRTDFIMSKHAFSGLARNEAASKKLFQFGVVDIIFQRVPCRYPSNIKLRVQESSKNPGYFAVLLFNVNGESDITAVELWQTRQRRWEPLRRAYGTVFDFVNPPSGEFRLRFQVGFQYWWVSKTLIPANWKPGATYDTEVQIYS